jgi:hypothetical protein
MSDGSGATELALVVCAVSGNPVEKVKRKAGTTKDGAMKVEVVCITNPLEKSSWDSNDPPL